MKTPDAKAIYGKRGCTVELRFADWKTHRGLQRFSGQTPERADAQVGLIVLAHNLRTLDKLRDPAERTIEKHRKNRDCSTNGAPFFRHLAVNYHPGNGCFRSDVNEPAR